jgi:hypothetical protein
VVECSVEYLVEVPHENCLDVEVYTTVYVEDTIPKEVCFMGTEVEVAESLGVPLREVVGQKTQALCVIVETDVIA